MKLRAWVGLPTHARAQQEPAAPYPPTLARSTTFRSEARSRNLKDMIDSARSAEARRAAAMLRRYQRYEALRPFTCPEGVDHYLLEPFAVAGDVLLVCPTCGFADLVVPEELPDLSARLARAAAFWRGIPG